MLYGMYLELNLEFTRVKTALLRVLDMVQNSWTTLESPLTSPSLTILIFDMGIFIVPISKSSKIIKYTDEYKAF